MSGQVLFIQGGGAGAHDEWDNKLVASLQQGLGADWDIRYPRMPDEDDPNYASWKRAIESEIDGLADGAVLVGHSIGGAILVNALAEHAPDKAIGALVLVAAPFVGEGGWPGDQFSTPANIGSLLPDGMPVRVFHGLSDDTAPPEHAGLYGRAIPQAHVHLVPGDHQLNNDLSAIAAVIAAGR